MKKITITSGSSKKSLIEALNTKAASRGMRTGEFIAAILDYAVQHKDVFNITLETPGQRSGLPITFFVTDNTKSELEAWLKQRKNGNSGYGLGALCCFILEVFLEKKIDTLIFG